jgi:hypothetical protein
MPRSTSSTAGSGEPTAMPPATAGSSGEGSGESHPTEPPPSRISGTEGSTSSVPTLDPTLTAGIGDIAAWQNDKRINALWAINENRNVFVGVTGVGWKKLANNDDTAVVALTLLSGSARLTQSPVNYRDEADGMIHEMYVW